MHIQKAGSGVMPKDIASGKSAKNTKTAAANTNTTDKKNKKKK